jgi:hypothetical protein
MKIHNNQKSQPTPHHPKFRVTAIHQDKEGYTTATVTAHGDHPFEAARAFIASVFKLRPCLALELLYLPLEEAIVTACPICHQFSFKDNDWHIFVQHPPQLAPTPFVPLN